MAEEHDKHDGPEWRMLGGGSPALIGDDGQILMGCPGLEGENVDELGEYEDPDNREERDRRQDRAEAAGWEGSEQKDARDLWQQAKQETNGELTLVQIGDKFYTFGEDAKVMQSVLQMGDGDAAEFDEEHLRDHLKQLVTAGHRVAISESTEHGQPRDAQPKAIEDAHDQVADEAGDSIDLGDEFDDEDFDTSFDFGANVGEDDQDDEESLFDPSEFEDDGDDQPEVSTPTPEPPTTESPEDSIGDARAATGSAIDQIPAGPIRSLVESLHGLREVRKTGKTTTTEVDPDYAKSIYDHLKQITRSGDGFGDVYDMADHLGPRSLGYASPAGVLAMIPPKFKGDDWEVRYAATQQTPEAPLASTGRVYDTNDEPSPPPTPKPAGRDRTPTPRRPRGVRGDSKLASIIRDVAGDDPADQEAFRDIINEVWQRKRQEVADHNYALSQVVGLLKDDRAKGGFTRKVRGADDADQIKAFDQLVDYAEREYPYLLTQGVAGEGGTFDAESRLRQVIAEGMRPYPAKHDDDVIGEALDFASHAGGDGASYMDPAYAAELAAMPFSRRGEWKIRYRKWATGRLSRWRRYARQMSLFEEDKHPRDESGKFASTASTSTATDTGVEKGPAGLTVQEAIAKASEGSERKSLNYDQARKATFIYTGTAPQDWSAVAIKGFRSVDRGDGSEQAMPEFEFPQGYKPTKTPWTGHGSGDAGYCELCGHTIKHAYHIQNDDAKLTMVVGSECVTTFDEGKSGQRLTKEAKWKANRDFLGEAWESRQKLVDTFGVPHERAGDLDAEMIPMFSWQSNKWDAEGLAKQHEIPVEQATKAIESYHELDRLLHDSKQYPVLNEPKKLPTFRRDSRGYWSNRPGISHYSDTASDTVISRWEKKNGDRVRELLDVIDELLGPKSTKPDSRMADDGRS